jgi:hypothetical protein
MRKGISIIIEVCITYFNPHFCFENPCTVPGTERGASALLFLCSQYLVPDQIPAKCRLRDVISTLAVGLCEFR